MTNWIINMSTAISEKLRSTRNSTSRRIITDAQNIVKDRYMEPDLSLDVLIVVYANFDMYSPVYMGS